MLDFAKQALIAAKEIKKDVNQINPRFNLGKLEAEVLRTRLKGILTQLKTENENRNMLLEEESKYGNTGIPIRLKNDIRDIDNKIDTLKAKRLEIEKRLEALNIE